MSRPSVAHADLPGGAPDAVFDLTWIVPVFRAYVATVEAHGAEVARLVEQKTGHQLWYELLEDASIKDEREMLSFLRNELLFKLEETVEALSRACERETPPADATHGALVDIVQRCEALLTRQGWTVPTGVPVDALAPEQQLLHDARAVLRPAGGIETANLKEEAQHPRRKRSRATRRKTG